MRVKSKPGVDESRRRVRRMAVRIMAMCIVVLFTADIMVFPALALEQNIGCEKEEHVHSDACYTQVAEKQVRELVCTYESLGVHTHTGDCYDEEGVPVCGYASYLVHEHDTLCYDGEGELICQLPVVLAHTHTDEACFRLPESHTHTDACYTVERGKLICKTDETEGHTHGEACYIRGEEPVCGLEESTGHSHTEGCSETVLICTLSTETAHTHDESCYEEDMQVCENTEDSHVHDESCYGSAPVCGLSEGVHVHGEGCYQTNFLCNLPEGVGHAHSDECYQLTLTCPEEEREGHSHTDECYELTEVLTCELEEGPAADPVLLCEKEEVILHSHGEQCFDENGNLTCTRLQVLSHIHSDSCFAVKEIAVDSESLTCTLTEGEKHSHNALCYGAWELSCGLEEHTHTQACGEEQPEADLPDAADGDAGVETANVMRAVMPLGEIPEEYIVEPTLFDDLVEGTDLTWAIIKEGDGTVTLRFDGTGPMPQYSYYGSPWPGIAAEYGVSKVVVGDGITCVSANSFHLATAIKEVIFGSSVETIGASAFVHCYSLSKVVFKGGVRTIEGGAFSLAGLTELPDLNGVETIKLNAFNCANLGQSIYLPKSVKMVEPNAFNNTEYIVDDDHPYLTVIDGVLYNKDVTVLYDYPTNKAADEFRVPDTVKTISGPAFASTKQLRKLYIPGTVESIKGYSDRQYFASTNLEEVHIEDGVRIQTLSWAFSGSSMLRSVRFPEDQPFTFENLFENCVALEYMHIPAGAKTLRDIHGIAGLSTVYYNAASATIIDRGNSSEKFMPGTSFELKIGRGVNVLPANFYEFTEKAHTISFEEDNYISINDGGTGEAFQTAVKPLTGLTGTIYVDKQGVVYSYDAEAKTAAVVYVQPTASAVTIPSAILAEDGVTVCAVTSVKKEALCAASGLKSLLFEAPGQITELASYALANCPTLTEVNGETTLEGAQALFPNAEQGFNVFFNTGLLGSSAPGAFEAQLDGKDKLTVCREDADNLQIVLNSENKTMEWVQNADGTGGYRLLTDDSLIVNALAGNTVGNRQNVFRIYFRLTDEDGSLSIEPGGTYMFNKLPAACYGTEDPYTVYLQFSPEIGGTGEVLASALYPSPESSGGGLTIWGVILTRQEAEANAGKLVEAENGQTIQAYWTTQPDPFRLEKTSKGNSPGVVSDGNGGAKPSIDLSWQIVLARAAENPSAYGKDYVKSVDYTDILTFPKGVSWNPEVIKAVKAGDIGRSGTSIYAGDIAVANLSCSGAIVRNARLLWLEEQETLALLWSTVNSSQTAEMNTNTLTLNILPEAVSVDMAVFNTAEAASINNSVTATLHYSYSEDVSAEASASKPISGGQGTMKITKTISGAKLPYFGEEASYTLNVYNDGGLPYIGEAGVYSLQDKMHIYSYISPGNMERMFAEEYGEELRIVISKACLGQWLSVTGTDGEQAWRHPGNSALGESGKELTVTCADGVYTVAVKDGESFSADTAAAALQAAGYAVTADAAYTCIWDLNGEEETLMLGSGEERVFKIYATFKNTFQILSTQDWPAQYSKTKVNGSNIAKVKDPSNKTVAEASVWNEIKREAVIAKSVLRNGEYLAGIGSVNDGDILDYRLDFTHFGSGSYQDLPMVDDLFGSQYLLVPATEANSHLNKLPVHTDGDGISYYILTEGSYRDVTVGTDDDGNALIAASVTVRAAADDVQVDLGGDAMTYSGLHTQIKWYFTEMEGKNYRLTVSYKALVDLEVGGLSYTIGNVVWMNDRPGARIFDTLWGGGTIIDFEKHIVTTEADSPADDGLTDYSVIGPGDTVRYRLTLHNTNNGSFILNGSRLADELPETFGVFDWTKDVNVTDFELKTEGDGITVTGLEDWYIGDSYSGLLDERQYILWPEAASVSFTEPGTVYIYFTLSYPEDTEDAELWTLYTAKAGGNPIDNTLYVYRFPSAVTHDMKETGRVLLQKGVFGMYHYLSDNTQYYSKAGSSRYYYNNRDSRNRAVAYYVVVFNDSNTRLYLNDLQDRLPAGFSFKQLIDNGNVEALAVAQDRTSIVTKGGYSPYGTYPVVDMGTGGILYRSAAITAAPTENGVTFTVSPGTGTYCVPYDEERGLCYLGKGDALVFAYTCDIGASTETRDSAANVIAMPYSDYLDAGLVVIDRHEMPITAAASDWFGDSNDGTRRLKTAQQVNQEYGFSGAEESWLVSEATVFRGGVVPGVTKDTVSYYDENTGITTPYTNSVNPQSNYTVNWSVRLHNSGTLSLTDYSFADIMPAPYVFEGKVTFTIFDCRGSELFRSELLTIPKRTGTEEALTVGLSKGAAVTVPFDGTKVDVGVDRDMQMSLHRENGNEVLTLYCVDARLSIPEGGYVQIDLSSKNPATSYQNAVYINRAILTPAVQEFNGVGQGSLIRDENGRPVAVENSSPVTVSFGFSTGSLKQVTETGNPGNTALSTGTGSRSIVLGSEDSTFTYTLTVSNDTDKAMTKLVLIDNLAQEGDHSPFDTEVKRNSEFAVELVSTPRVTVTTSDGVSAELDARYYTVEYSSTTDFGGPQSNDWKGESAGTNAVWSAQADNARAIRVVIRDDSGTLIPAKAEISVSFEAKAGADAQPGETAWNSFGYHYALQGITTGELEAMPLPVGVTIPGVPVLEKRLADYQGQPFAPAREESFTFLVYQGSALTESYDSAEALLSALENANIQYKELTVTVPAGQSKSAPIRLDDVGWDWIPGNLYTVVELSTGSAYEFERFIGGSGEAFTFAYDPADSQTILCENRTKEWTVALTKTDDKGVHLAGAVFALFSPAAEDRLTDIPDEFTALNIRTTMEKDGTVWYLTDIAATDESGKLTWEGLLREQYYLLEVIAPAGHTMTEAGRVLYRSGCDGNVYSLQVINSFHYEMPKTGGAGVSLYRVLGGSLMMAAALLTVIKKRRPSAV